MQDGVVGEVVLDVEELYRPLDEAIGSRGKLRDAVEEGDAVGDVLVAVNVGDLKVVGCVCVCGVRTASVLDG
jgi:hypothetical protein